MHDALAMEAESIFREFDNLNDMRGRFFNLVRTICRGRPISECSSIFYFLANYAYNVDNVYCRIVIFAINDYLFTKKKLSNLAGLEDFGSYANDQLHSLFSTNTYNTLDLFNAYLLFYYICHRDTTTGTELLRSIGMQKFCLLDFDPLVKQPIINDSTADIKELAHFLGTLYERLVNFISTSAEAVAEESNLLSNAILCPVGNILYSFKRFSSIYPALMGHSVPGGGFFIRWRNVGIAIDPGYHFLYQYLKLFRIEDIDIIIITHAHDDHCADVDRIFSLMNKRNKLLKKAGKEPHKLYFLASENTIKKYSYLGTSTKVDAELFVLEKYSECGKANRAISHVSQFIKINTFNAYHEEDPIYSGKDGSSIGLGIQLFKPSRSKPVNVLFSGDTKYNESLGIQYSGFKPNVVFLNIGNLEKTLTDFDTSHLGFFGCANILSQLARYDSTPALVLLNEFGYEWRKDRISVCHSLSSIISLLHREKVHGKMRILPIDTSLRIDLDQMAVHVGDKLIPLKEARIRFNKDEIIYY